MINYVKVIFSVKLIIYFGAGLSESSVCASREGGTLSSSPAHWENFASYNLIPRPIFTEHTHPHINTYT